jgi:muramoyltetrapeptide carboxypeptidase
LDYLFDENIGTLWALRGGEGSADLIPHLHKHQKRIAKLAPKTIISFSDGSALINYFSQTYNWPCWHGITALQVQPGYLHASNVKTSLDILLKAKPLLIKNLKPLNETAKTNRLIKGKLTGGNLSLLNISIGDLWEIDTKNKIVFIEEVNEKAHVIIRTLKYLQRIGKFKQAKAILFGDFSFSRQGQTKEQQAINRALNYFASTCSIPVLQTKQFGHGKYNTPLPLGQQLEIDLNQCCLTAL